MLVAVTLWEVLAKYLPKEKLTIKWPNDIYFGNKKLVGILIENILIGKYVGYSIAGIGVNVNQTQWRSDAPNPISMKEIMGQEFEAEALMNEWISSMKLWENCSTEALSAAYLQRLYRREGWYMYMEREVSVEPTRIVLSNGSSPMANSPFLAQFIGITPQGELILRNENNEEKTYHFKQIRFVI